MSRRHSNGRGKQWKKTKDELTAMYERVAELAKLNREKHEQLVAATAGNLK